MGCGAQSQAAPDASQSQDDSAASDLAARPPEACDQIMTGDQHLPAEQNELRPEDLDFAVLGKQCTRIKGADNRGITLKQLRRVRDFIRLHVIDDQCGWMSWMDLAPAAFNIGRLHVERINLYQACVPCISAPIHS